MAAVAVLLFLTPETLANYTRPLWSNSNICIIVKMHVPASRSTYVWVYARVSDVNVSP